MRTQNSTWIGLFPSEDDARRISTTTEDVHLTILYLGKTKDVLTAKKCDVLREELRQIANAYDPFTIETGDYGVFSGDKFNTLYVSIARGILPLRGLRTHVEESARFASISFDTTFDFTPHFTVGRINAMPENLRRKSEKITLQELHLVVDGQHDVFTFGL